MDMKLLLQSLKHMIIGQFLAWDYEVSKNDYNEAKNEHKDLLRPQRFGFVIKCLKEFDMANPKRNEAI
jgi:hypothetical protein